MKHKYLFILTLVCIFCTNLYSQTVYVTKSGKKYHKENCSSLRSSSTAIDLKDAIRRQYTPCSRCKPQTEAGAMTQPVPKQGGDATPNADASEHVKIWTKGQTQSVQCSGTTKKGTRCKRKTRSPNGLCKSHGGE